MCKWTVTWRVILSSLGSLALASTVLSQLCEGIGESSVSNMVDPTHTLASSEKPAEQQRHLLVQS